MTFSKLIATSIAVSDRTKSLHAGLMGNIKSLIEWLMTSRLAKV